MKTDTQIKRAASAKIREFIKTQDNKMMQYYYIKGFFHINNISDFRTAKEICERATGLKFKHFTNSMCKLIINE